MEFMKETVELEKAEWEQIEGGSTPVVYGEGMVVPSPLKVGTNTWYYIGDSGLGLLSAYHASQLGFNPVAI